jgi:hypothetical protein
MFMVSHGIVHRDIAARNILLMDSPGSDPYVHAMLCGTRNDTHDDKVESMACAGAIPITSLLPRLGIWVWL